MSSALTFKAKLELILDGSETLHWTISLITLFWSQSFSLKGPDPNAKG